MRARFNEAIAAYCLQGEVQAAVQGRHAAPVLPLDYQDTAGREDVEIMSRSSTEVIYSDREEHWNTVEASDAATECEFFNLPAADPPSPDRCEGDDRRGPPSPDPADQPDNKRPRPPSCLRWLSSPVLRQATALPSDGNVR